MNSTSYNRRMKRMTQLIKSLTPTLRRIPAPLPRPGTPALTTPKVGDAKKDAARRAEYGTVDCLRLDSSVPRYWLTRATDDTPRRNRS